MLLLVSVACAFLFLSNIWLYAFIIIRHLPIDSLQSQPIVFFTELEQNIPQFVWKHKKNTNSQSNLDKGKWSWRNQLFWFQTILQSYNHQDSMVLAYTQKRNIDQGNKMESPQISPHIKGHLIFDKGGKTTQWGKNSLFNKWFWEN